MPFPADDKAVRRAEEKLGRRLPDAFVARLKRQNGGEAYDSSGYVWWLHPVYDDSDRRRLKRSFNDIIRETVTARQWPGFPVEAIAVGADDAGNFLVLLPAREGAFGDTVYVFDHETREVKPIAETFDELADAPPEDS